VEPKIFFLKRKGFGWGTRGFSRKACPEDRGGINSGKDVRVLKGKPLGFPVRFFLTD
jgi:hypothetical protein